VKRERWYQTSSSGTSIEVGSRSHWSCAPSRRAKNRCAASRLDPLPEEAAHSGILQEPREVLRKLCGPFSVEVVRGVGGVGRLRHHLGGQFNHRRVVALGRGDAPREVEDLRQIVEVLGLRAGSLIALGEHRHQQCLLGREVMQQRRVRDPALGGDLAQRRAPEAALAEQPHGGREDLPLTRHVRTEVRERA
jgi:hypothetical protein